MSAINKHLAFRRGFFLCMLFFICSFLGRGEFVSAQSVSDSLKNRLSEPGLKQENRSLILSHLARSLYEKDMPAALRYAAEAIRVAHPFADGQYKAFGFATMTYLNIQRDSLVLAQQDMDSAIYFADRTGDKIIKGYVWLRKGWQEYFGYNTDKAVDALHKALSLLEGQGAYEYESLVYHYLASVYADLKDAPRFEQYVQLSLSAAYKSGNPDILCTAYLAMGSFFQQKFRQQNSVRAYLDSSLSYNSRLLALAQAKPWGIINHSNIAAAALNTANIYWEFFPVSYKDSAVKYIYTALDVARRTQHEEVIANCYGILSEYARAEGDYAEAEKLLLAGLAEIQRNNTSRKQVTALMLKGLAAVAEKKGDRDKALSYYKEYSRYEREAYDAEKLAIAQRLEAQYQSEKKDRELSIMQERAILNRRLNFIYIGLIVASLLALLFLFRSYHFRLKSSLQQQKLRAEEAARLKAEQELLQERQERLQKELLAGALQVEEKNDLLQTLRDQLGAQTEGTPLKIQVEKIIKENYRLDADIDQVKADFSEIHPGFFTRLQEKAQNALTRLDLKYCSYILMGMSNKEIAVRLGVDPKSIRMARYRIKQKLQLGKEDNLDEVIRQLG